MAKITQKDINDAVWKACDTFRGSIDPSVYKDYVLTMLFLKYLSDVHDDKMEGYLKKYNGDVERAKRAMQHERFIVPEHSHFKFLYDSRNEANIGELINIALADLEEANREKLYSEDGAGIFQNIDFNNSKLGEPKDKNTRLKNLLLDFNKDALNLRPSHLDGVICLPFGIWKLEFFYSLVVASVVGNKQVVRVALGQAGLGNLDKCGLFP